MRNHARVVLLVLGALALPSAAYAQVLGSVAGAVKDTSGAVLPGVTVEASSPALIEKVRSVASDRLGQYRIVNLPPGTYAITFTLTGFSTVVRDGIEVSLNFTANVNADMRIGTVQETITVTGETPVVDLQSTAQTITANARAFKELPTGGSWVNMAQIIPAVNSAFFGTRDVGGLQGDQTGTQISAHGGLPGDGVSMIDGMRIGNMYLASNLTNMSLSPLLYDEVNISFSGQTGESGSNGVIMNAIPKSGGNAFHGSFLANGSWPALQGDNATQRLKDRGAPDSNTLKKLYDINGAVGGPIKRDRLWFYYTSRYFTNEYYLAGLYFPVDPSAFRRVEDLSRQAFAGTWTADNNIRVTWAATDKQKISGWYAYQRKDDPHWLQQILFTSPEATQIVRWPTQLSTITWTYTATSRLLLEAGIAPGESPDTITQPPETIAGVPIFGLGGPNAKPIFAARSSWFVDRDDRLPSQTYKGSMSYVTGSHNVKVGMSLQQGHFERNDSNHAQADRYYLTLNDQPLLVFITSPLAGWTARLNYNLGIYAQDSWTMNRVTVNAGIRFDFQNESADAFTATPGPWLPNRNTFYPEVKNIPNWKDVNPRVSVAYDLFGNGKTAVKASASRGVQQDSVGIATANHPANTTATSVSRFWGDFNGNLEADCELTNPAAHFSGGDVCGGWSTLNFGKPNPQLVYDPAILNGWGVRPNNWEFSAGVQHELLPRLSINATYFRRILGNFQVTDNAALTAADYDAYSVVVPADARLPNSGQTISSGLYDLNPAKLGQVQNVVTAASKFGTQIEHWDGFDVTANGRFNRLFLQGGVSAGRRLTDNCEIRSKIPEASFTILVGVPTPLTNPYCRTAEPLLTQVKGSASYELPWYGIRISGTLQSVTGPPVAANNTYACAATTGCVWPGLGRPFSSGSVFVNLVEPGSLYGDRLNQIDLRFTKILRMGTLGSLDLNVDLYNAFNSDAILTQQNTFGLAWQNAQSVIQPRFVKFAARWDF